MKSQSKVVSNLSVVKGYAFRWRDTSAHGMPFAAGKCRDLLDEYLSGEMDNSGTCADGEHLCGLTGVVVKPSLQVEYSICVGMDIFVIVTEKERGIHNGRQ